MKSFLKVLLDFFSSQRSTETGLDTMELQAFRKRFNEEQVARATKSTSLARNTDTGRDQ